MRFALEGRIRSSAFRTAQSARVNPREQRRRRGRVKHYEKDGEY